MTLINGCQQSRVFKMLCNIVKIFCTVFAYPWKFWVLPHSLEKTKLADINTSNACLLIPKNAYRLLLMTTVLVCTLSVPLLFCGRVIPLWCWLSFSCGRPEVRQLEPAVVLITHAAHAAVQARLPPKLHSSRPLAHKVSGFFAPNSLVSRCGVFYKGPFFLSLWRCFILRRARKSAYCLFAAEGIDAQMWKVCH